jgi:hypothetical protein
VVLGELRDHIADAAFDFDAPAAGGLVAVAASDRLVDADVLAGDEVHCLGPVQLQDRVEHAQAHGEALEDPSCLRQLRRSRNRVLEAEVDFADAGVVTVPGDHSDLGQGGADRAQGRAGEHGDAAHQQAAQGGSHGVQVEDVDSGDVRNGGSAVGEELEHPFLGEHAQGLAHGSAGNAEPGRQGRFLDAFAGLELAAGERFADELSHPVSDPGCARHDAQRIVVRRVIVNVRPPYIGIIVRF